MRWRRWILASALIAHPIIEISMQALHGTGFRERARSEIVSRCSMVSMHWATLSAKNSYRHVVSCLRSISGGQSGATMPAEPLIAGREFQRGRREADQCNPSVIVCGNIMQLVADAPEHTTPMMLLH